MKIIIDILDEEYMPECPHCEKSVEINGEFDTDSPFPVFVQCDNCHKIFEVVLIVRQAKSK